MKKKPQKIKPYYEVAEPEGQYSVLKETDVHKLADKILKAIGEDQQKKALLLGLLVSDVATKKEFSILLEELKAMREASDRRFEASEKRFEAIETELKLMREDSDKKFEAINKRFEAIDKRFEAIESELKAMREASEKRFEASEKRFEAIETELKLMREDSDKKFEAINKRFEAIDKRFEAIDRRFEAIDRRFETIDSRFEAMDRKFEELRIDMDKRFEQQRQDFQLALKTSIEALDKSLTSKIDKLGSRWGMMSEHAFREGYAETLAKAGFTVTKWKKRDTNKVIFPYPRDVEIDILIKNGITIAIEVKSSVTKGEVEAFDRAIQFYEKTEGKKVDEKVIVGVYPYPGVIEYARLYGIKIVPDEDEILDLF